MVAQEPSDLLGKKLPSVTCGIEAFLANSV